jgi:cellulose synthase (UDP-forming)
MVNVGYPAFLLHFWGMTGSCLFLVSWIKRQGWLRPAHAKVMSWERWLFPFVTWPWILQGVLHALVGVLLKKELSFRVTPKGETRAKPLPGRVLLPYTLIVIVTFIIASLFPGGDAHTYHSFATMNIVFYVIVLWAALIGHRRDNRTHPMKEVVKTYHLRNVG